MRKLALLLTVLCAALGIGLYAAGSSGLLPSLWGSPDPSPAAEDADVSDLPFETTTITDGEFASDTKWYRIQVINTPSDGDPVAYTVSNVQGQELSGHNWPALILNEELTADDDVLWCFVSEGSGYRIYNKSTGTANNLWVGGAGGVKLHSESKIWTVSANDAMSDTWTLSCGNKVFVYATQGNYKLARCNANSSETASPVRFVPVDEPQFDPTAVPEVSTSRDDAKLYAIVAFRGKADGGGLKYVPTIVTASSDDNSVTTGEAVTDNAKWYVKQGADNTYLICNYGKSADNEMALAHTSDGPGKGVMEATSTECKFYILPNGQNDFGLAISSSADKSGSTCLDKFNQGDGLSGGWHPGDGDWEGTTWFFVPLNANSSGEENWNVVTKAWNNTRYDYSRILAHSKLEQILGHFTSITDQDVENCEAEIAKMEVIRPNDIDVQLTKIIFGGKRVSVKGIRSNMYLIAGEGSSFGNSTTYDETSGAWDIEAVDNGVKVKNHNSGKYIATLPDIDVDVTLTDDASAAQVFAITYVSNGFSGLAFKDAASSKGLHFLNNGRVIDYYYTDGGSTVVIADLDYVETDPYAINVAKDAVITNGSRYTTAIVFGDNTIDNLQSQTVKNIYFDRTADVELQAAQGQEVSVKFMYEGHDMHQITYIDFGDDGFDGRAYADGGDMVNWFYRQGSNASQQDAETFTIPADATLGRHRVRFKIDWDGGVNSIANPTTPGGVVANIAKDGGIIVDAYINITEPIAALPFIPTTIENGEFAADTKWYWITVEDRYLTNVPGTIQNYDGFNLAETKAAPVINGEAWCLVATGNGYKIFNRAEGPSKALTTKNSNNAAIKEFVAADSADDLVKWSVEKHSTYSTPGYYLLKNNAGGYMQNFGHQSDLGVWSAVEDHSRVKFIEIPADQLPTDAGNIPTSIIIDNANADGYAWSAGDNTESGDFRDWTASVNGVPVTIKYTGAAGASGEQKFGAMAKDDGKQGFVICGEYTLELPEQYKIKSAKFTFKRVSGGTPTLQFPLNVDRKNANENVQEGTESTYRAYMSTGNSDDDTWAMFTWDTPVNSFSFNTENSRKRILVKSIELTFAVETGSKTIMVSKTTGDLIRTDGATSDWKNKWVGKTGTAAEGVVVRQAAGKNNYHFVDDYLCIHGGDSNGDADTRYKQIVEAPAGYYVSGIRLKFVADGATGNLSVTLGGQTEAVTAEEKELSATFNQGEEASFTVGTENKGCKFTEFEVALTPDGTDPGVEVEVYEMQFYTRGQGTPASGGADHWTSNIDDEHPAAIILTSTASDGINHYTRKDDGTQGDGAVSRIAIKNTTITFGTADMGGYVSKLTMRVRGGEAAATTITVNGTQYSLSQGAFYDIEATGTASDPITITADNADWTVIYGMTVEAVIPVVNVPDEPEGEFISPWVSIHIRKGQGNVINGVVSGVTTIGRSTNGNNPATNYTPQAYTEEWKIAGNATEGFKLVNRQFPTLVLATRNDNDNEQIVELKADGEDANYIYRWDIKPSGDGSYFAINPHGNGKYLNSRGTAGQQLKFWSLDDGGKLRFLTADGVWEPFIAESYRETLKDYLDDIACFGAIADVPGEYADVAAAIEAGKAAIDGAEPTQEAIDAAALPFFEMIVDQPFTLENVSVPGLFLNADVTRNRLYRSDGSDYTSIFTLKIDPNTLGRYNLYNPLSGKTVKACQANNNPWYLDAEYLNASFKLYSTEAGAVGLQQPIGGNASFIHWGASLGGVTRWTFYESPGSQWNLASANLDADAVAAFEYIREIEAFMDKQPWSAFRLDELRTNILTAIENGNSSNVSNIYRAGISAIEADIAAKAAGEKVNILYENNGQWLTTISDVPSTTTTEHIGDEVTPGTVWTLEPAADNTLRLVDGNGKYIVTLPTEGATPAATTNADDAAAFRILLKDGNVLLDPVGSQTLDRNNTWIIRLNQGALVKPVSSFHNMEGQTPRLYYIRNVAKMAAAEEAQRRSYLTGSGATNGSALQLWLEPQGGSFWVVQDDSNDRSKIYNAYWHETHIGSVSAVTTDEADGYYYIIENHLTGDAHNAGLYISQQPTTEQAGGYCLDRGGFRANDLEHTYTCDLLSGGYSPRAGDYQGTAWIFVPVTEKMELDFIRRSEQERSDKAKEMVEYFRSVNPWCDEVFENAYQNFGMYTSAPGYTPQNARKFSEHFSTLASDFSDAVLNELPGKQFELFSRSHIDAGPLVMSARVGVTDNGTTLGIVDREKRDCDAFTFVPSNEAGWFYIVNGEGKFVGSNGWRQMVSNESSAGKYTVELRWTLNNGAPTDYWTCIRQKNGQYLRVSLPEGHWTGGNYVEDPVYVGDRANNNNNETGFEFFPWTPDVTGIETVDPDNMGEGFEGMYNLQGIRVNPEGAAPGIYIVRRAGKAMKVFVR